MNSLFYTHSELFIFKAKDVSRSESHKQMNFTFMQEKERFANGEKKIAIISEASSGIYLHVSPKILTLAHFKLLLM